MEEYVRATKRLADMLSSGEVRGALAFLNGLTSFRFTALYRFDKDMLSNRVFFDRQNPQALTIEAIPVEASYCIYVRNNRGPFVLADSLTEGCVRDHPKRESVRSYCGVPLVDEQGQMFGSVCHFDFEPHPLHEMDILLLEEVAPLLMKSQATA